MKLKPTNLLCRWFPGWFVPAWERCTLASLWDGDNAAKRMMNTLSPHMRDAKFKTYLKWQRARGCNATHVFVANQGDGENAGYSVYGGVTVTWAVHKPTVKLMRARMKAYRRAGMGVVVWLLADDSNAMNRMLLADPMRYVRDLDAEGVFDYASMICLGLELSEYTSVAEAGRLESALRGKWKGKVATHDVSGSLKFAGLGDIVFGQVEPATSDADMLAFGARLKSTGKPGGIIEHSRGPNRARSEKLIAAGLPFVGNW
jgi:hypothetical protein